MLEVRLLVDAPENWVKDINRGHSAFVRITDIKGSDKGIQDFVEIASNRVSADKLIKVLGSASNIRDIDLVRLDPHRIMGTITTHECPVCSSLSGLNSSLLSASTREDGRMEWKLLISGDETLKQVTQRLTTQKVNFEIVGIDRLRHKKDLTTRQEQIIKMALDLGFFEFPKRIRLEELSERLGISPGTLSEILRRAEKNILVRYFQKR